MMETLVVAADIRNGFKQFAIYINLNKIIAVKLNPTRMHPMATDSISEND
jgi:hypothetical protein